MKTFIVLSVLSLLAACQTTYVRTSSNAQDFDTAKVRCQNDPDVVNAMSMAIANAMSPASSLYSASAQMYFKACMREQGWVPQSGKSPQPPQQSSAPAPTPKENCYAYSKTPADLQVCLADIDQ